MRTFPLVAIAACGFVQASERVLAGSGEGKGAALQGIITGIGFIGGGAIFRGGSEVHGTAAAATLWTTGAIGFAVGVEEYDVAVVICPFAVITLWVLGRLKSKQDDWAGERDIRLRFRLEGRKGAEMQACIDAAVGRLRRARTVTARVPTTERLSAPTGVQRLSASGETEALPAGEAKLPLSKGRRASGFWRWGGIGSRLGGRGGRVTSRTSCRGRNSASAGSASGCCSKAKTRKACRLRGIGPSSSVSCSHDAPMGVPPGRPRSRGPVHTARGECEARQRQAPSTPLVPCAARRAPDRHDGRRLGLPSPAGCSPRPASCS